MQREYSDVEFEPLIRIEHRERRTVIGEDSAEEWNSTKAQTELLNLADHETTRLLLDRMRLRVRGFHLGIFIGDRSRVRMP